MAMNVVFNVGLYGRPTITHIINLVNNYLKLTTAKHY